MHRLLLPIAALILGIALITAYGPVAAEPGSIAGGGAVKNNLTDCTSSNIPANDDGSSPQVPLPFVVNFFGTSYSSLYVNNNGNVTFDLPLGVFTPFDLTSTNTVIIAPFFGDVDTTGSGSGLTTYGNTMFAGRNTFCVNWVNVGYFFGHTDRVNSFQLLLVDRGDRGIGDFDIIFNYDGIQWETGDASGGVDGLGGSSARAGYSNGDAQNPVSFELAGSAVNGAFLDSSPGGLANNSRNSVITGRYVFEVRNGVAPEGGSIAGTVLRNDLGGDTPVPGARVQACLALDPAPPCLVGLTNSNGDYLFDPAPGVGNYFITAFAPGASSTLGPRTIGPVFMPEAGEQLEDVDIKLLPMRQPPPGVIIETPFRAGDGTAGINSVTGAPFRQIGACPNGSGSWSITLSGVVIASGAMTETESGKYKGTIPPLRGRAGRAEMNITILCPGGVGNKDDDFDIYIDPSGHVTNSLDGSPVEGATVTLFRSDNEIGPFTIVPDGDTIMSPSNRTNPDLTNEEGFYRWDVIAGFYKVRVEKTGCHAPGNAGQPFVETGVLPVPPPQLEVDLELECPGGTGPTNTPPIGATNTPTRTNTPVPPTPTPAAIEGDADCNGVVNSIDVALILQRVAGLLNALACPGAADVNDDGQANSVDAALILQFIAGLLGSL